MHHRPDGAEDLVSDPHGHGGPVDDVIVVELDVDRLVALVEAFEDALGVELAQVAFGHLQPQHGLDPAGVGLVLAS